MSKQLAETPLWWAQRGGRSFALDSAPPAGFPGGLDVEAVRAIGGNALTVAASLVSAEGVTFTAQIMLQPRTPAGARVALVETPVQRIVGLRLSGGMAGEIVRVLARPPIIRAPAPVEAPAAALPPPDLKPKAKPKPKRK